MPALWFTHVADQGSVPYGCCVEDWLAGAVRVCQSPSVGFFRVAAGICRVTEREEEGRTKPSPAFVLLITEPLLCPLCPVLWCTQVTGSHAVLFCESKHQEALWTPTLMQGGRVQCPVQQPPPCWPGVLPPAKGVLLDGCVEAAGGAAIVTGQDPSCWEQAPNAGPCLQEGMLSWCEGDKRDKHRPGKPSKGPWVEAVP